MIHRKAPFVTALLSFYFQQPRIDDAIIVLADINTAPSASEQHASGIHQTGRRADGHPAETCPTYIFIFILPAAQQASDVQPFIFILLP